MMLLSVYNAPPPPKQGTNPLFIVLGVCGGGCLLVVIVFAILGIVGYNKGKDLINASIAMQQNMPKFLNAVKSHDYNAAAALVDPQAKQTLTAEKIQSIEEEAEAKLGSLQSIGQSSSGSDTNNETGPNGQLKRMDFIFRYKLTYQKGSATAKFTFSATDPLHPSGLVSDFKIEPNEGGSSNEGGGSSKGN
jgi:hypothetical protein